MIVIDSSAIISLLLEEPEGPSFAEKISSAAGSAIAAPTLLELMIVALRRKGPLGVAIVRGIVDGYGIEILPFDADLSERAIAAYERFGKARHAAKLNFGDCMAYALAKSLDAPLLFKGNDFSQTDVKAAL